MLGSVQCVVPKRPIARGLQTTEDFLCATLCAKCACSREIGIQQSIQQLSPCFGFFLVRVRKSPEHRRSSYQPSSNVEFGLRWSFRIAAAFRLVASQERGRAECGSHLHSWVRWHQRVHSLVRAGLEICKYEFGFMICRQWMRRSLPMVFQRWRMEASIRNRGL